LCLSLGPTSHKSSAPLELIFSDVWGLVSIFSSDDFCYFVMFVDVHIQYIWYYPLIVKFDVFYIFHHFQVFIECNFH